MSIQAISNQLKQHRFQHVVVTAEGKEPNISSLKSSQFQLSVKTLKKLGYMFRDDRLVYQNIPGASTGVSYTFPFTNGVDSFGVNVSQMNGGIKITVALLTTSGGKITVQETYQAGNLDKTLADNIKELLNKLSAKMQ